MKPRIAVLTVLTLIFAASFAVPAEAGPILQPAAASTDMGTFAGSRTNTINQSGLSTGYTSLVTDFGTYIAGNPTHNSALTSTTWTSALGTTTGNFDFDLGGSFTIESFALWNIGGAFTTNILDFTLLADDNAAFSSPVVLGSFTANPNTGPPNAVLPEVFSLGPTPASFVRLQIDSVVSGGDPGASFGEAAFEVQAQQQPIPEPTSLAIFGMVLLVGIVAVMLQRRKAALA